MTQVIKSSSKIFLFCFLFLFIFAIPLATLAANYSKAITVDPVGIFPSSVSYRYNRDSGSWEYNGRYGGWKDVDQMGQHWYSTMYTSVLREVSAGLIGKDEQAGLSFFKEIYQEEIDTSFSGLQEAITDTQTSSQAAAGTGSSQGFSFTPTVKFPIGGQSMNFTTVACQEGEDCEIPWLGEYVSALYQYGVGLAAVLAAVMIMVGGFIWLMSAGSPDKVGKAKDFIISALTGLFLALFSFIILTGINPRLVEINPLSIVNNAEQKNKVTTDPTTGQPKTILAQDCDEVTGQCQEVPITPSLEDEYDQTIAASDLDEAAVEKALGEIGKVDLIIAYTKLSDGTIKQIADGKINNQLIETIYKEVGPKRSSRFYNELTPETRNSLLNMLERESPGATQTIYRLLGNQ